MKSPKAKWTYNRIQEYVRRVRRYTLKGGCRRCNRMTLALELVATPSLTGLSRGGYGIARIKSDIRERGLYCRSCAKGYNKEVVAELVEGWREEKKKLQCPKPVMVNMREWPEEEKWEYIYDDAAGVGPPEAKAKEVFEGDTLERVLEILRETPYNPS